MEAQLQRPTHGHHYEEDPQSDAGLHSVIEGEHVREHNQQGEKKSVLKKVKDKAKKIKDNIKKHGQGDEHEHDYRHDESPEEEEEEDEETVNDPEIHGSPIVESTVIRSTNLPRQMDVDVEKPTDTREFVKDEGIPRPAAPGQMRHELERPQAMELHTFENKNASSPINQSSRQKEEANAGEPRVKIGTPMGLEDHPHSPKNLPGEVPPSNYQSKVSDSTGDGGKEAEVAPLIRRLDNLNVYDESDIKPESEQRSYTESHNQFAAQPNPTKDQFNPDMPVSTLDNPESNPEIFYSNKAEGMPRDTITGKVSSATSAITDRAVSAKNVVASKLGYCGSSQEGQDSSKKPVSESAAEYAHKAAKKLNPVYEKVAGAGTAVLSKVQGSGGAENQGEGDELAVKGTDKGVSMTGYLAEKFTPGDEDKALSEVITDALYKKKEGTQKTGEEQPPMGKVTESEEVVARLGTGTEKKREGEDALAAGRESSGAGVVDRLKDAVSLWLGKSTGMQTAQDSIFQSYVSDVGSDPVGGVGQGDEVAGGQQPRLQESGN